MERLQTAANAKKAQLERIRATASPREEPGSTRQAEQADAAAARKLRTTERKRSARVAAQQKNALREAEKARQSQAVVDENVRKLAERVAQAEAEA